VEAIDHLPCKEEGRGREGGSRSCYYTGSNHASTPRDRMRDTREGTSERTGEGFIHLAATSWHRRVLQRRNAIGLLDGVEFMISVPVTLIIHRNNRIPARSLPKRPLARSLHAALVYRRDMRNITILYRTDKTQKDRYIERERERDRCLFSSLQQVCHRSRREIGSYKYCSRRCSHLDSAVTARNLPPSARPPPPSRRRNSVLVKSPARFTSIFNPVWEERRKWLPSVVINIIPPASRYLYLIRARRPTVRGANEGPRSLQKESIINMRGSFPAMPRIARINTIVYQARRSPRNRFHSRLGRDSHRARSISIRFQNLLIQ